MAHDVLISYSSHDKLQADAICNRLESQGIRCWIAPRDVPVGTEYADSIVQAIESAKAMVLVYSRNADKSEQVKREVERAVSQSIHIMPVRIEDGEMSKSFEYYVGSIHWLDAITPPLEDHIDKLAHSLKALLEGDSNTPSTADSREAASASQQAPAPPSPEVTPTPPSQPALAASQPGSRRTAMIVAAAAVLLAIAGIAVYFLKDWPEVVLDIAGKTETEALRTLESFKPVTVKYEKSNRSGGVAIRTEPGAGQKAAGGEITLYVSGMATMPDLKNKMELEAIGRLKKLAAGSRKFSVKSIKFDYVYEGDEGTVRSSQPAAGADFLLGETVTLYVSADQVQVPGVVGLTKAVAQRAIASARLQADIVEDWESGVERGVVLRTLPKAGTKVVRHSDVSLFVVGVGGWAYIERNRLDVGKIVRKKSDSTLRATPGKPLGKEVGKVVRKGDQFKVLDKRQDWVKMVIMD
jgi:beta-lactam-binding protein with PASTA domain